MKIYLIFIIAALALISCCDSDQKSENHTAHHNTSHASHGHPKAKQLLEQHDSLMPKMEEIMTIKASLASFVNKLDSLNRVNFEPELQKSTNSTQKT